MQSIFDLLTQYEIFSKLRPSQLNYLSINSSFVRIGRNNYLQKSRKMVYFLVSGKIKVCELAPDGEDVIKYILTEGNFFGESMNNLCSHGNEFAKGTEYSVVVAIPRLLLDETIGLVPDFASEYSKLTIKKCGTIENQLRTLMLKDRKERLVRFLELMAMNEGRMVNDKLIVRNYLTHSDIASLIGATRVTVTKFLNELKLSGKISYSRREFQFPVSLINLV